MSYPAPTYATIDEWTAKESISFSVDSPKIFKDAVDKVIASLDDSVELLGFGEALHGGEDILRLRNRLFQRLVEAHGYSSIALESSFPRAHLVNEYVLAVAQNPIRLCRMRDLAMALAGLGQIENWWSG